MPEPRAAGGAAAVDGQLYVAGGVGPRGLADAMFVFHPESGRWSSLEGPPTPREHLGAAEANGFVVAAGGEADVTFAEAEALDIARGRWVAFPGMPTPRHGLGVVAAGDVLYTIAGAPVRGLSVSDAVEAIDLSSLR